MRATISQAFSTKKLKISSVTTTRRSASVSQSLSSVMSFSAAASFAVLFFTVKVYSSRTICSFSFKSSGAQQCSSLDRAGISKSRPESRRKRSSASGQVIQAKDFLAERSGKARTRASPINNCPAEAFLASSEPKRSKASGSLTRAPFQKSEITPFRAEPGITGIRV